jgi:catechol 2,3-dioxygenase-like lactoylglutathione lyase family enzyme
MIKNIDHVTIVVDDVEKEKKFFMLLDFKECKSVIISGDKFSKYLGINSIEAKHVTLFLEGSSPRQEIQLLQYLYPKPLADPAIEKLNRFGYNHLCLAVDDIEYEVTRLKKHGVHFKNNIMEFNDKKLVFFSGPGGITLELTEYL